MLTALTSLHLHVICILHSILQPDSQMYSNLATGPDHHCRPADAWMPDHRSPVRLTISDATNQEIVSKAICRETVTIAAQRHWSRYGSGTPMSTRESALLAIGACRGFSEKRINSERITGSPRAVAVHRRCSPTPTIALSEEDDGPSAVAA